jgi:hypothetical protein
MSRRTATNKKKKKRVKRPTSRKKILPESIDELLNAGSAAMESLDIERAYQMYCQAATILQGQEDVAFTGIKNENNGDEQKDLINVLEKMGELQVSIGDQDLAKQHFLEGIRLLEERRRNQNKHKDSDTLNLSNKRFHETYSNLCFYVGQLSIENEALESYQRGICSLEQCIQLVINETNVDMKDSTGNVRSISEHKQSSLSMPSSSSVLPQELNHRLSKAYCNLAELYLTDLCEQNTAERECERYLEKALQFKDGDGEPLVDALQTMASLRLSQADRQLEAVPFILRAYNKQRVGSEALATLVGLHQVTDDEDNQNVKTIDTSNDNHHGKIITQERHAQELVEVEAASNLPEYEFRCQTAKLLLECAELLKENKQHDLPETSNNSNGIDDLPSSCTNEESECINAAICVLGSLLAQNDEVIEIWFLTGCAFAVKSPKLVDETKFYLERAKEMLTVIRKTLEEESKFASDDDERQNMTEQLEMNAFQIHDVQSKLDELPSEVEEDDAVNDSIRMDES